MAIIGLIDGDIVAYRLAVVNTDKQLLYSELDRYMADILTTIKASHYGLYVSGKYNFRKSVMHTYKAHRDPTKNPLLLKEAKDYLIQKWGGTPCHGMEADDAISIMAAAIRKGRRGLQYVICTIDKDLDQIPGIHYNFVKKITYTVSKLEAQTAFCEQMLSGDRTDNILGLPDKTANLISTFGLTRRAGVGKKTAERIIAMIPPKQRLDAILDMYKDYYGAKGTRMFTETYACIRMLTDPPQGFGMRNTLVKYAQAKNTNKYILVDREDRKELGYGTKRINS